MPEVGIREGEKLHEIMVTVEDSLTTMNMRSILLYILRWSGARAGRQSLPERRYRKGSPIVPEIIPNG